MRTQRFSQSIISIEEIRENLDVLLLRLRAWEHLWLNHHIHDADFVGAYLFEFLAMFRPRDFLGGPRPIEPEIQPYLRADLAGEGAHPMAYSLCRPRKLVGMSITDFYSRFDLRSVPGSVNRTLQRWRAGLYPLQIFRHMPTALEVFELQSQGRRMVTLPLDEISLATLLDGKRDPFTFVLHDLIHADLFFSDSEMNRAQVLFFKDKWMRWQAGEYEKHWQHNDYFTEKFSYLIGDMNSHPAHMEVVYAHIMRAAQTQLT